MERKAPLPVFVGVESRTLKPLEHRPESASGDKSAARSKCCQLNEPVSVQPTSSSRLNNKMSRIGDICVLFLDDRTLLFAMDLPWRVGNFPLTPRCPHRPIVSVPRPKVPRSLDAASRDNHDVRVPAPHPVITEPGQLDLIRPRPCLFQMVKVPSETQRTCPHRPTICVAACTTQSTIGSLTNPIV